MDSLKGQIALVTGASRGLGRAIAIAFAEAGADVAINYNQRSSEAEKTADDVRSFGRRAIIIQADVANTAQVDSMAQQIDSSLGSVTILANNAGIAKAQAIHDITEHDFEHVMRVNLTSMFLVTQRFLPAMRAAQFGRIINLSSVAAQVGGVVGPHYAASKAGMIGMTHAYANLLVKEGITVNAIAPALIETDMVISTLNATTARIPLGRFGRPDEVASVAVMLAANGYITGQTINVNGGWYMSS
jgi:3-oxoacyl-[acyl-carrier protein] reductase